MPLTRSAMHMTMAVLASTAPAVAGPPSLSISPASGGLGTVLTISIEPQTPGYELTNETTAMWFGVYNPPMGSATELFTVTYADADIALVDPWTVQVLLGGGAVTDAPDIENVMGGGSVVGTLMLSTPPACPGDADWDGAVTFSDITAVLANFGADYGSGSGPGDADRDGIVSFSDITAVLANFGAVCSPVVVEGASNIALNTDGASLRRIVYPDGPGGITAPEIGAAATQVFIHRNSFYANPAAPSIEQLAGATDAHYAVRLQVAENSHSSEVAPSTLRVDIVAYDSMGSEVDRAQGVLLTRLTVDSDPNFITYASDLSRPIVVLDHSVDQMNYPNFQLILGTATGTVGLAPSTK